VVGWISFKSINFGKRFRRRRFFFKNCEFGHNGVYGFIQWENRAKLIIIKQNIGELTPYLALQPPFFDNIVSTNFFLQFVFYWLKSSFDKPPAKTINKWESEGYYRN